MLDDDFEASTGEIRAVSASVLYDGSLTVMLSVPGQDELVETSFAGNEHTLLMNWSEPRSKPIDLDGVTLADRRCQEIVARAVGKLNREMDRQRERMGRHRDEWPDDDVELADQAST